MFFAPIIRALTLEISENFQLAAHGDDGDWSGCGEK
jgi:hypothetical protein